EHVPQPGRRRRRNAVSSAGRRRRPAGPDRDQDIRRACDLRALPARPESVGLPQGVAAEEEVMSLNDADDYDRFMGRFSRPLAVPFAEFAGLPPDGRILDVGCGPGALTAELVRRAGPGRVTAVDPSQEFVAAVSGRHPGVQVIRAPAEDL